MTMGVWWTFSSSTVHCRRKESWRKLNEHLRMSYLLAYHLHGELHGVEGKPYKISCWSLTLEFDVW